MLPTPPVIAVPPRQLQRWRAREAGWRGPASRSTAAPPHHAGKRGECAREPERDDLYAGLPRCRRRARPVPPPRSRRYSGRTECSADASMPADRHDDRDQDHVRNAEEPGAAEIQAACSRPSSVRETVRPPSIKSDNPVMMPPVASVATNEGMRSFTWTNPLASPIARPTRIVIGNAA